jgi:hypothetical protein
MNRQSVTLYIGILALTLLISGCTSAPTATPAPATAVSVAPTAVPTKVAAPTAAPTQLPAATATKPAPTVAPTVAPTIAPTLPPAATATKIAPAAAPTKPAAAVTTPGAPSERSAPCFACHGPFEKIVARTVAYKTASGEAVNPHTTVDRSQPKVQAHLPGTGIVVDCLFCHTSHELVAAPKVDLTAVSLNYCFIGCHHEKDFKPCKDCHG